MSGSAGLPIETLGIHHIGIAVQDLDTAVTRYAARFGCELSHRAIIVEQKVEAASIITAGDEIELIAPHGDDAPLHQFLERRGEGLHHLAFAVADIDRALARLVEQNVPLVDAESRIGFHGLPIAFVHPKAHFGVLVELVQVSTR